MRTRRSLQINGGAALTTYRQNVTSLLTKPREIPSTSNGLHLDIPFATPPQGYRRRRHLDPGAALYPRAPGNSSFTSA